ncbi:protein kinase [bacterium]|nr:protein kinase [bacterium]
MLNDRQASELISRSMHGPLTEEQQRQMDEYLEEHGEAREFARVSRLIQDSLSDVAVLTEAGDESVAPGLSRDAKSRLSQSVADALANQKTVTPTTSANEKSADDIETTLPGQGQQSSTERRQISRFTLLRKIGEGGLGTVWLARDEKLKRTVAIKEMSAAAAESPIAWQRFHREAEITGLLEHPNVVPLYQFGSDPKTGYPFCVMRFVGKHTLADAIIEYHERRLVGDDDRMELHRLLRSFLGVCQAIAYAHSRGVIHRDLKPENIALDSFGQVIVLDWGLAKLSREGELGTHLTLGSSLSDSALTQTMAGEVIGTPLYMSPEQASGELDQIDERTDVYGLGAILFAILTGAAPHEDSGNSDGGNVQVREMLNAIAAADTPSARAVNPEVSSTLDAICRKAMSKKRFARQRSARELADDIERWMAGEQERRRDYDSLRLEGRELKTGFTSAIRSLGTNARFMSRLPPIQGIIDARSGQDTDEESVWRPRLSTIFEGLLYANADYAAVSYCRVEESSFREIVRVERHSTDSSNIRSVPLSRLAEGEATELQQSVIRQQPEEVFVALCPIEDARVVMSEGSYCVVAGVPVYDERTEEPFGIVMIERSLAGIFASILQGRVRSARQMFLLDPDGQVLLHHITGQGVSAPAEPASVDHLPDNETLQQELTRRGEFVDSTDRLLYATPLETMPGDAGLTLLLSLRKPVSRSEW